MADEPLVLLIEDDDAVRDALQSLLESANYAVSAFASGEEFLGADPVERAGCILLDLRLPGMDGHQVQHALKERDNELPVILITGAHPVKNGLSPLIIDLLKRDTVTLVAVNPAAAIHDFEIAIQGETSEDVPGVIAKGEFGMAFETCRLIKGDPATKMIPVILLTAKGRRIDEGLGREVGASDYITKPFSPGKLVGRVQSILGVRR